jgi:hypothetical protein
MPLNRCLKRAGRRVLGPAAIGHISSDLGACLPLLSVADPCLPMVRGPSAAQEGHGIPGDATSSVSGTAGRLRRPALSCRMWPVSWQEADRQ